MRALWALLCLAALALRLGIPTGFMPGVEHGRLTIVECPGSNPLPPMGGMHHSSGKASQTCPYATATGAAVAGEQPKMPLQPLVAPVPFPLGVEQVLVIPRGQHDRPPAIGPPIPA
jgi:hypothetical protein